MRKYKYLTIKISKEAFKSLNEIREEIGQIKEEITEVRSLVSQIIEGQDDLERAILNRLTIFEECINRT